jgi:hypothetical protein
MVGLVLAYYSSKSACQTSPLHEVPLTQATPCVNHPTTTRYYPFATSHTNYIISTNVDFFLDF